MGLGNSSNAIYLTISNGKICRQFKSPTANSKERVNKKGNTVHEEFYDHLTGTIKGIEARDTEYGKNWYVNITDEGVDYILQFQYSSGYANGFLRALPNADVTKPLTIIPNEKIEGDKKKVTVFLKQNGESLKWFYTKDNPQGMPELKKIKVKGKDTWDDSDIMEFLENMVKNDVLPKLGAGSTPLASDNDDDDNEFVDATTLPGGEKMPF